MKTRATIHTLRHSYATHLLEEGVSIRYVSQYLGHATLEQTLVYTHLTAVSEAQTQAALANMSVSVRAQYSSKKATAPCATSPPTPNIWAAKWD